jgi:hypothetical protein
MPAISRLRPAMRAEARSYRRCASLNRGSSVMASLRCSSSSSAMRRRQMGPLPRFPVPSTPPSSAEASMRLAAIACLVSS